MVESKKAESTQLEWIEAGFQALSDLTRLHILQLLKGGTRCVCQIQTDLPEVAPNLLSHHLRVLREAGLVRSVRRGRWIDYSLDEEALKRLREAIPHPDPQPSSCRCEAL
ncbi:MAG: helix-turn-helix transcriptional regulator [Meiothermus silvanus]|jgi:ArsR family transcriptional regulator|nr:helix-turn-helix transcriptional regulator [Allomeiothermus silvanus]